MRLKRRGSAIASSRLARFCSLTPPAAWVEARTLPAVQPHSPTGAPFRDSPLTQHHLFCATVTYSHPEQCDEAHPTCRNCQKSKRECLGYDPIFKQQPGPAQIQPAPSAAPPITSSPATAAPPAAQVAYSHVPQGYAPATPNYAPAPGHSTSPPAPGPDPSYELSAAIDPALAGADPASMSIPPVAYDPSTRVYVRKEDKEASTPPPTEGQPLKSMIAHAKAFSGKQPLLIDRRQAHLHRRAFRAPGRSASRSTAESWPDCL